MSSHKENNKRLAKNTVLLYIRSFFSLVISLYTSRLILQTIGVDDYGLYNVVGGFVSMFWLVSGSLSTATTRFLGYEMGAGNRENLGKTFSMSLLIMAGLALVVIVLTETFGLWFVFNRMTIPPGRETAVLWVFQCSILSVVSGFLIVPYNSAIVANEKMSIFAYIGIAEAILRLVIALLLAYGNITADKLILYAVLWLAATLLIQITTSLYSRRHFEECRLRIVWDKDLLKKLIGFTGWHFLGKVSGTFSGQGVNMILNVVFGPAVNAARGLAMTVNNTVNIFVYNFTISLNPQITKAYAGGDAVYTKSLVFRGMKFSFFILYLIVLPLFLEAPILIDLWLGETPEHLIPFLRLILILNLTAPFHTILAMGISASGKIRDYMIVMSLLDFLIFPASYVMMHNGFSPEWVYIISIIVGLLQIINALFFSQRILGFRVAEIVSGPYIRMIAVMLVSFILPTFLHQFMAEGWGRFFVVCFCSAICVAGSAICIGCNKEERKAILDFVVEPFKR